MGQPMGMAPMPMGMAVNNTQQVTNTTTIINQAPEDPYTRDNGKSEAHIDREFRIMAGTQDSQNVWCIECKEDVQSEPSRECSQKQLCTCTACACCGCPCFFVPFCLDDWYIKKHKCPKCAHHLALYIPGEAQDELGFRQDDLPPGYR